MSGLEQRTKDGDGAPVDCRDVTPRVAGASRPATWLAETAQTPKTSMEWASARCRDVPRIPAQTAETIQRSPGQLINMWWTNSSRLETARTGITEKRLKPARTHKTLRLDPRSIATRFARTHAISIPGGRTSAQTQTSPKTPAEKAQTPKSQRPLFLVSCASRRAGWHFSKTTRGNRGNSTGTAPRAQASANCGNALIDESVEKTASDEGRCLLLQTARIAGMLLARRESGALIRRPLRRPA